MFLPTALCSSETVGSGLLWQTRDITSSPHIVHCCSGDTRNRTPSPHRPGPPKRQTQRREREREGERETEGDSERLEREEGSVTTMMGSDRPHINCEIKHSQHVRMTAQRREC